MGLWHGILEPLNTQTLLEIPKKSQTTCGKMCSTSPWRTGRMHGGQTHLPAPRRCLSRSPGTGTGLLASRGGPARPNRLPTHTREKSRSPSCLSGVALRLRAPAAASLDAAGRREREALGSLQARMGASAAPPAPSPRPGILGFCSGSDPSGGCGLWHPELGAR